MKKIGILGGMSLQSTMQYIEELNREINHALGGLSSPRILLSAVDFAEYGPLERSGDWDLAGEKLAAEAKLIEAGGADFLILTSTTMHKVSDKIIDAIKIPFIHIADATKDFLLEHGIKKIGLLATKYVMEQDFYKGRLEQTGIDVIVPNESDRIILDNIIFKELCLGIVKPESATKCQEIISKFKTAGAQCLILGVAKIGMLVKKSVLPLHNITEIHVKVSAKLAMK